MGTIACATLFTAGILGRLQNAVLWCVQHKDLFGPGLAGVGLPPDRVIYVEATDDKTVFLVMEEALRHPGLSAVVGEVAKLPMTASRRLVLAAEKSGVMGIALRRGAEGGPNAACTRWCISPNPSPPLPVPGLGRARWQVQLTRCRGGEPKTWILEACDAQGDLGVPAILADAEALRVA
jgi:protein ImuA